jgi:chalcone isomerase-like protein
MARLLSTLFVLAVAVVPCLAEEVGVSGSDIKYESELKADVGDKKVNLVLTGTALRKKLFFNVYTIGSYVQEGAGVHDGDELAGKNCPKQLHLVLERDVKGSDMADALRSAIRANYDDPQFAGELKMLVEFMGKLDIKKGDNVRLTHVPGKGLHADIEGKAQLLIENPSFSKAVWDIYFGKNNLGDAIKKALVARL